MICMISKYLSNTRRSTGDDNHLIVQVVGIEERAVNPLTGVDESQCWPCKGKHHQTCWWHNEVECCIKQIHHLINCSLHKIFSLICS